MATIVSTGVLAVVLAVCVVAFTTVIIILVRKRNPNARAKPETYYKDIKEHSIPSVINTEMNIAYDRVLK